MGSWRHTPFRNDNRLEYNRLDSSWRHTPFRKWELKPDSEYWPDPFDNKEEYLKNLRADGKAVPMALGGAA